MLLRYGKKLCSTLELGENLSLEIEKERVISKGEGAHYWFGSSRPKNLGNTAKVALTLHCGFRGIAQYPP